MTIAPLTRTPADPHPGTDTPPPDPAPSTPAAPSVTTGSTTVPAPRRPRIRAPGHEPEPLAAGVPHPRRHAWMHGGPARGSHPTGAQRTTPERTSPGIAVGASAPGEETGSSTGPAAGIAPGDPEIPRIGPAVQPDSPGARRNGSAVPPAGPGVRADSGPTAAPPLQERAGALVRSVLEVLAGRRQPVQLAAAVTPQVLRYLAASRQATARSVAPGRVHVRRPHPEAAEVVAVCRIGDRTRAVALRLDIRRGPDDAEVTWICTALRLI